MSKINLWRVILGGVVAGLVIDVCEGILNGVILKQQWADAFAALGKASDTMSVKQIVAFNLWGLAAGVITVWLYAGLRPRFGAGPRTAVFAGLTVWALAFALATAVPVFFHLYPVGLGLTAVALEAVEMILAGLAGGAIYKESSASGPKSVAARA
jgi:hypothetical protein